ncbi:hypothetical protein SAMN06295909_2863 [Plantibacter sp. VKM Ac-1784]|uniref:Uncharacterized protein n=1 Tax=Plantibacter elymi (nom. nud.) TaxID=199708 RepID=A0ABY1RH22_9MICO|nr:hypothetical protein [Plantibacter sp. VKM Ac-1784]SMQ72596.1 hypothetical protein SAMN06295909_2863 [Plantibacter sp. VKM Ac-1784]
MLNRYALARTVGGLLGLGVGYLLWEGLRNAMLREIPAGAWEAATISDAFVSLIGIAAVALIMTPGLVLSAVAEQATRWMSRSSSRRAPVDRSRSS